MRDFLDFYLPFPWLDEPYHYPTFNFADSGILVGAICLFIALSREEKQERVKKKQQEPQEAESKLEAD